MSPVSPQLSGLCDTAERSAAAGAILAAAAALDSALALDGLAAIDHARLAACGAAIASRLEAAPLDEATRTLLLIAAKTARVHSGLAADWPAMRRAEYCLASAHLAAGDARAARRHALLCLELSEAGAASEAECRDVRALLARVRAAA